VRDALHEGRLEIVHDYERNDRGFPYEGLDRQALSMLGTDRNLESN